MEFGDILRELLDEREITQKQFAEDLNMAVSTLGNYIRDNREPDYHTLKRMADYFGVSVDYLIDHHAGKTSTHEEDHVLQIFRSLSPKMQRSFLDIGIALLKNDKK